MGNRIAFLRHKKGLSQAALGRKLGLSASAIGMYEQGRREPPVSILISLAKEFGVTTDYLLTGSTRKEPPFAAAPGRNIPKRANQMFFICAAWFIETDE